MRVFCFGDIHIGPSRYQWVKDQEEKICDWVLGKARECGCSRIVFLGDAFRDRMHSGKDKDRVWFLFRELAKEVDVVVVAGNHDYYDKGCEESGLGVLKGLEGVHVVDMEVCSERVRGRDVVYVPWRWCVEEFRVILEGDVVIGHFELREAVMWEGSGQVSLDDFELVRIAISGHIHKRQVVGNVIYPSVPFQRGFGDGLEVGGVVVDLETMEWEWVNGYGVRFIQVDGVGDLDGLDVKNCYVRVKDRGLVDEIKKLGVVGIEYLPDVVRGYDGKEELLHWEAVKIDVWQMLEEYGRKVLKVGEKEVQWLRSLLVN
jgi:DNA repair exonuclease SbcCD nuclease subunit